MSNFPFGLLSGLLIFVSLIFNFAGKKCTSNISIIVLFLFEDRFA